MVDATVAALIVPLAVHAEHQLAIGTRGTATAKRLVVWRRCVFANAHAYSSILSAAFYPFVAVLVKSREVFPELLVTCRYRISLLHQCKFAGELSERFRVKFILVGLCYEN